MSSRTYEERYSNVLDKQYFNFAAAHFLIFEDGEREPLHGHNYRAELEIEGDGLDPASLVADFLEVKPLFKKACDVLDHHIVLPRNNPHLKVTKEGDNIVARWRDDVFSFPQRDVVVLDIQNTSSEMLARTVCEDTLQRIAERLPNLRLARIVVTVSESPGQAARYERVWSDLDSKVQSIDPPKTVKRLAVG